MKINLIQVSYHYGFVQEGTGAGRGPLRYLEAGTDYALQERGFEVAVHTVHRSTATKETLAAVVEGNTELRAKVAKAVASGGFPVVLSGGCSACLGVLAGLGSKVGIVWFDAHGDINTPETTLSGFFEGMPLAIATGLGHRELWRQIADAPPVPPSHTLLVGGRALDPGEQENIDKHQVQAVTCAEVKAGGVVPVLRLKLEQLRSCVGEVYLHFDIDVLDPTIAPGVDYRTPDGFSLQEAEEAIQLVATHFRIKAAALTAYNPHHEEDDRTLRAGMNLLQILADAVRRE